MKEIEDKIESMDAGVKSNKPYIELNVFVKKLGLAATGGQAKNFIREGNVMLNGTPETRNKKKLFDKDVVEIAGKRYVVEV